MASSHIVRPPESRAPVPDLSDLIDEQYEYNVDYSACGDQVPGLPEIPSVSVQPVIVIVPVVAFGDGPDEDAE